MSESEYLRNAWTMAGWASELDNDGKIARRLLDTPVVVFRDSRGAPQALLDRCPHRFAPLSRGKVKGDFLECGYHGLGFDGTGKCVHDPYIGANNRKISVRRFPVAERDRMIWVWFGEENRADESRIPSFPEHTDPRFRFVFGHSNIPAHYELVTDNLMDLSHTTFIHPAFGGEFWVPEFSMEQPGDRVIAHYRIMDAPASIYSECFFPAAGKNINEYTTMYWEAASAMRLDIKWAFTDQPDKITALQPSTHVLAPADKNHTWYFWASGAELAAPVTDDDHREALIQAFEREDSPMLEACEHSMEGGDFWDLRPAVLPYDRAAIRARQILRRLIRQENSPQGVTAVG
jgi:phenylpropionate dioxygenase-like ring-hydroxylating dioxygenase large terminal subunit